MSSKDVASCAMLKRDNSGELEDDVPVTKTLRPNPENEDPVEKSDLELFVRVKTKKMAILLSYSGKDYYGLQRNANVPTIEEEVLKAMLTAGVLTQEQYQVPQTLAFQRAARTDKGVSASKQILSIKLPLHCASSKIVENINCHLPPQIRVIDIKKATQGFNCKNHCDGRTYVYMTPSFAFAPSQDKLTEDYRIPVSQIQELNKFLEFYKGSHNFHNFTSGRKPTDPSNNRYIVSFECGDPFMCGDLEFVHLRVRGQSFMLHQIRKMVALAMAKMRGLASEETLKKAWNNDKVDLPKAPGLGLILEEVHYDGYNRRYGEDGIHEPLLWDQHKEVINTFTETYIFPTIIETEKTEKSMLKWLDTLSLNSYDIFDPEKNHRNHVEDRISSLRNEEQDSNLQQNYPIDYSCGKRVRKDATLTLATAKDSPNDRHPPPPDNEK